MNTVKPISVNTPDQIIYSQTTAPGLSENDDADSTVFAEIISNAINTGTPADLNTAGLSGSFITAGDMAIPVPGINNTVEQAIMTASATGESKDAMMALMMLMMMMQSSSMSSGGGGEMSMLMQMMATVVGQMMEKDSLRDEFLYTSGGEPYTLDTIDNEVFGNEIPVPVNNPVTNTPQATDAKEAELPLEWWRPAVPALVSSVFDRDPRLYRAVVDQFNVETAERYRPGREGHTYCNVYVWDVTRAMGAELPYYTDPETGAPREYPDVKGAAYNGAIAMDRWLKTHGGKYGWRQVTAEEAQMHANQGKPAVTAAGDVGHVQMVVPSSDGSYDPVRGVTIAQAGRTVSDYMHISGIYGASTLNNKVTYWVHD